MRSLELNIKWLYTFRRFFTVGVANTALHWLVFGLLYWQFSFSQSSANLAAFTVAVTFSFFANARYTFQKDASTGRYLSFFSAMAALSYLTGLAGEAISWYPLTTLVVFSTLSLVCGYLYSTFYVFRA